MMNITLTKRQSEIVRQLMKEPATGRQLAEKCSVTIRTIQNDIKSINSGDPVPLIISGPNGYSINPERKSSDLVSEGDKDSVTELLRMFAMHNFTYNYYDLAEDLYISTSTLDRWLRTFSIRIQQADLTLVRNHNELKVTGSEDSIRRALHSFIVKEVNSSFNNKIEEASSYFGNLNIGRVKSIVLNVIRKYNYYIDPYYTNDLLINILVSLARIRGEFRIDSTGSDIDHNSSEYKIASEICSDLSNHWYISITEQDIEYIAKMLTGQIRANTPDENSLDYKSYEIRISQIIRKTLDYYMLKVDTDKVLPNFTKHVYALIQRAKNHQSAENLIAGTIKQTSPFTYDIAVHMAKELEQEFEIHITDEEIGLLSIYVGFLVESSMHLDSVNILLLCPEYHNIPQHLLTSVSTDFSKLINLEGFIFNENEARNYPETDLLVTTMPLWRIHCNNVLISPFYTDADRLLLTDEINRIREKKQQQHMKQMLLKYFSNDFYFRRTDLKDSDSAITFLSSAIINAGICDESFTHSVLQREQTSSTCFFNAFAVPHGIELNAKKTQIAVLINPDGIVWNGINIKCVFLIAVCRSDRKEFMKIYTGIIKTLCNDESIRKIVSASNFDEFIKVFL